jgi:tRNA (guanine37-N1)-methyltransferase
LGIIPNKELDKIYNSYDIIGDIAVIRLTENLIKYGKIIAEAIMETHKNVKTVLAQTSPVRGDFRLKKLDFIAGEEKTETVHKEFGCILSVDVRKCYFSPRLLHERVRIADHVRNGEIVLNMFAGVGSFSIIIAKRSQTRKIYSIDINPAAFRFMQKNAMANRVYGRIVPLLGDARKIIEERLNNIVDRVLMPLPQKALEYLPYALLALKRKGGWIHCYLSEHAKKDEDPIQNAEREVKKKLKDQGVAFEFDFARVVRTTGPRWYQVVLDIRTFSEDETEK